MKKNNRIKVVYVFYILAALLCIYMLWQAGSAINEIRKYRQMGAPVPAKDCIMYVLQVIVQPLVWSFLTFGTGYGIGEIKKLNDTLCKTSEKKNSFKKDIPFEENTFEEMRKDDLYMLAKEKGLSVTRKTTKETLIALLKEGDYSPVKEKEPAFGPCTEK